LRLAIARDPGWWKTCRPGRQEKRDAPMSGGSGRPPAAQKILQSLRPPSAFVAPSRTPFAAPDDYHRFPAAPATATSGGVGADSVEESLVIRAPVR
jgi:transcription factor E2F3